MPLTGLFRVEANKWKSRRVPAIADHFLAGEFEFGLPLAAQEFSGGRGRHLNPWSQSGQGWTRSNYAQTQNHRPGFRAGPLE